MANTVDLKSTAERLEGSNPSTPTTAWDFVDLLLAEAEEAGESYTFPAKQVTALRDMIALIPTSTIDPNAGGRGRKRQAQTGKYAKSQAIKLPIVDKNELDARAEALGISFNAMVTHACEYYINSVTRQEMRGVYNAD